MVRCHERPHTVLASTSDPKPGYKMGQCQEQQANSRWLSSRGQADVVDAGGWTLRGWQPDGVDKKKLCSDGLGL